MIECFTSPCWEVLQNVYVERRQHFVFDVCYSYEMPDQNDTHVILPVYRWESAPKLGFSHEQLFGDPLLIAAPRRGCTYDTLYQLVLHRLQRNLHMPDDNSSWWNTKRISNGGKHFFAFHSNWNLSYNFYWSHSVHCVIICCPYLVFLIGNVVFVSDVQKCYLFFSSEKLYPSCCEPRYCLVDPFKQFLCICYML